MAESEWFSVVMIVLEWVTVQHVSVTSSRQQPFIKFLSSDYRLITVQCTIVQSAVLRSHVVSPSVRL